MEVPPNIEGLLHLAGFVVLLSVAYLGLDKFEKFKTAFDMIAPELARQRKRASDVLLALDIKETDIVKPDPLLGPFWQHMVCFITGIEHQFTTCYAIYFFIRRQKHIPLLNYFRNRWDTRIVGIAFVISLAGFLFLIATTLDFSLNMSPCSARLFFFGYIVIILWILFSLSILHWRLQNIDGICEKCYERIQRRMDEIKDAAKKIVAK